MRKKPPLVLIIIIMNIRLKVKYLDFKLIDKQHVQKFLSLIKKVFFTNRNFLTILIDTFEYFQQNMRLRVIHQYLSQRKKIETVIIECSGEERTASSRELTLIRERVTRCAANYKNCYKCSRIFKNAFIGNFLFFLKQNFIVLYCALS